MFLKVFSVEHYPIRTDCQKKKKKIQWLNVWEMKLELFVCKLF